MAGHLNNGFHKTARVLATSRNRAVVPIILAAAKSTSSDVRSSALRAAIRRRDSATHTELIGCFSQLDEADRIAVCTAHRQLPHHAAPALKAAILTGDEHHCANACNMIVAAGDFDMLRTLVSVAENKRHHSSGEALAAITGLVDRLFQDLALWAGGIRLDGDHDPSFVRHHVLNTFEQSLGQFVRHQRLEILDAFLLLTPVDNPTFLKILRDPRHACHAATIQNLTLSQDSGVMERLIDLLRDTDTPPAALQIIAARRDPQFLNILLHELRHPVPIRVLHNMKRLKSVAWLESERSHVLDLGGRAQAAAVELAAASDISRESLLAFLANVLQNGLAEGRRASCQALSRFMMPDADQLVFAALNDPDASVQAAAIRQLRARRMPNSLGQLAKFLDSTSAEVRHAARSSLAEFNFIRYRAMFDLLDDEAARSTGALVRKVDNSACQKLIEDLNSPSISARLRGIEMAIAMSAADDVEAQLIELTNHENVAIRKEAILALAHCTHAECDAVLEAASKDRNGTIADAARQSLKQRHHAVAGAAKAPTNGQSAK
jgi:HEAT repeat protein